MRPTRLSMKNGLFHITTRTNNKKFRFKKNQDFENYLEVLGKARDKYKVKVHSYCLMSNHTHLVVSTPEEDNLSIFMQYVNGQSAKKYNRAHNRTGHLWGERFASTIIESSTQFFNAIHYIEMNMCRANNKKIKHPKDWEWSSYNQHAEGKGSFEIDYHDIYTELAKTKEQRQRIYKEMTENSMEEKNTWQKQPELTKGLIYGSKEFVEKIINNNTNHTFYKNRKAYNTSNLTSKAYSLKKPPK